MKTLNFHKKFSPVLLYHSVEEISPSLKLYNIHNVTPENFYYQLNYLKKYYDFIKIDKQVSINNIVGKCAVTFDDAYKSVFKNAIPILRELNIPATIYINGSNYYGKLFWRDSVRQIINKNLVTEFIKFSRFNFFLSEKNFYTNTKNTNINSRDLAHEINNFFDYKGIDLSFDNIVTSKINELSIEPLISYGNHTLNHFLLSSLSYEEQAFEIEENIRFFKSQNIDLCNCYISIPFGGNDSFNNYTIKVLKRNGYNGFLLSRSRLNLSNSINSLSKSTGLDVIDRFMPLNNKQEFKTQILKLITKSIIKK